MKKLKLLLVAVVLVIIFAFVLPGVATTEKIDQKIYEKSAGFTLLKSYAENINQYGWSYCARSEPSTFIT